MSANEIVVLGRLGDPYGIRGWIRLFPFGDDPLSWAEMPLWWLGKDGGPWQEIKLKGLKQHGDGLVVLLDGVSDRTQAEPLKGMQVGAPREALPQTGDDEFYWGDLLGMQVVNQAEEVLGEVVGLLETGANDVLRVQSGDQPEQLLPFVDSVVLSVDKLGRRIRVDWGSDW